MRLLSSASVLALLLQGVGGGGGHAELATDLGFDDGAAWLKSTGTGSMSISGGEMVISLSTAGLVTMNGAKATTLAASLTAVGAGVVCDVVLVVSEVTSFTSGTIALRNGTPVAMGITVPGTYTYQITTGSNAVAAQALRFASMIGGFKFTSCSIKVH